MHKPLGFVFKTKLHLAFDICLSLNPSGNKVRLRRVAERLVRRYHRDELALIWLRSNKQFLEYIDWERKKFR